MKKIKIALVDDHNIFLKGLQLLLNDHPKIEIVQSFLNPKVFLQYIKQNDVDIVLMDINMPELNGISCAKEAKKINPNLSFIALSMHFEDQYIQAAKKADFDGYLLKNTSTDELEKSIIDVYYGKKYFSKDLGESQNLNKVNNDEKLIELITEREKEIIKLICESYSAKEIASKIYISESTVKTHRRNIFKKLQVSSTPQLIMFANKNKILLFD
jgi:DNA-binding NarL/FixJ family response regulator